MKKKFMDYTDWTVWEIINDKIERQSKLCKKIMEFCGKKESLQKLWWDWFFFIHPNLNEMVKDEEERKMWCEFLQTQEGKDSFDNPEDYEEAKRMLGLE